MNFQHYYEKPMEIWETSGDFMQTKWETILEIIGENPFHHYVTITIIIAIIVQSVIGSIFSLIDITNKPAFLRKYKVQDGTNEPVDKERFKKVLITVIINQTIVSYPITCIFFYISSKTQEFPSPKELPTLLTIFLSIIFFILVREIAFYYSHRLLHTKYLYKTIHKKHHEWTSPIAITATYCHPIEHIFTNLIPIGIGPALLQSHIITMWLWIIYSIFETLSVHSGYHLPFLPSSEYHDYHHLKFNQNFGVIGLMDWLHNTDDVFRNNINYKRNFTLFNFKSARESFPDKQIQ